LGLSRIPLKDLGHAQPDHPVEEGYARKSVQRLDCRAVGDGGLLVERRKLAQKPLAPDQGPLPARRHAGSGEQGFVHGHQAVARKDRRSVPIHGHVIAQGFLDYAEERRKTGKPLFSDPDRSRGGKAGNPQFNKVAGRIGEWVQGLGIPMGLQPNHVFSGT
jgi:hypothetical protein